MSQMLARSKMGIAQATKRGFQVAMLRSTVHRLPRGSSWSLARQFQSATKQQGQAGLAQAPEPNNLPDSFILNNLPASARHKEVASHSKSQKDINGPLFSALPEGIPQTHQHDLNAASIPLYHRGPKFDRVPYWQKINRWKDVTEEQFLSYQWSISNNVQGAKSLEKFLQTELPEKISLSSKYWHISTRDDFIEDVMKGINMAPMSIRLPPHILSSIDWSNPLEDPLRRQFIPMGTTFQPDHPMLTMDSLHEQDDSPVEGLVHRYTDKCLFLASSHCPLYCRYCTRAYAVGANTKTVTKASLKPKRSRWNQMLAYIEATPVIQDVVISGGDSYSLEPHQLREICDRLLEIPHIRRFRIATKGLCAAPSRTLDPNDSWTDELIEIAKLGRQRGKHVALHTHFNHPNEFSWVTREAAQKLFANGVTVRNQSVLLKGVNDSVETMSALIRELADNNIQPYYVYAGDLVKRVEDLRTPLQTILDLETQLRGSIAGFMTPQFVVDLPGGGGKRLASSYQQYDRSTGISTFIAPAVTGEGKEGKVYQYYDPLASLPKKMTPEEFKAMMDEANAGAEDTLTPVVGTSQAEAEVPQVEPSNASSSSAAVTR